MRSSRPRGRPPPLEISPGDSVAFLTVAIGVLGVALIACCVPARRAAQTDPLTAIRIE